MLSEKLSKSQTYFDRCSQFIHYDIIDNNEYIRHACNHLCVC